MNSLRELIGQVVLARIETENDDIYIRGKVVDVRIEDFYFEEKNEPIYITVQIDPIEDLPQDIDIESLLDVPLDNIYR